VNKSGKKPTAGAEPAEGKPGSTRVRRAKVGSFTEFKELTLALARSEHTLDSNEPKLWRERRRRAAPKAKPARNPG
jgi:hypothetical protein